MAVDRVKFCPLLKDACIEDGAIRDGKLVACNFWVKIRGKDPQTGAVVDDGDCAINWIPMLLIENNKVNLESGAAIESFRNEMVKANDRNTQILLKKVELNNQQPKLIEGNKK